MRDDEGGAGDRNKIIYDTGHLLGIDSFSLAGCVARARGRRGDPVHEAVSGGGTVSVVVRIGGDICSRHGGNLPL